MRHIVRKITYYLDPLTDVLGKVKSECNTCGVSWSTYTIEEMLEIIRVHQEGGFT